MAKDNLKNQYIWLTGASSGIGLTLLERLLEHGAIILATARNLASLNALQEKYPKTLTLASLDVSDKAAVVQFKETLTTFHEHIDIAIFNAGQCLYMDPNHFNTDILHQNFSTNFFGTAYCIELVLPFLEKSQQPHLVGMSSSVSYIGLPRAEGYGSSKAATTYLLESLEPTLFKKGIGVSIILPGFVDTPLTQKNDFPMPWLISAAEAAEIILEGINTKKSRIEFPKKLLWTFKFLKLLPHRWRIKLCAKYMVQL